MNEAVAERSAPGFGPVSAARLLALLLPLALLGGALGSQYLGGLHPCEMCMWQRWPHAVAIVLALLASQVPLNRPVRVRWSCWQRWRSRCPAVSASTTP